MADSQVQRLILMITTLETSLQWLLATKNKKEQCCPTFCVANGTYIYILDVVTKL